MTTTITPEDLDWSYDADATTGANVRALLRAADDHPEMDTADTKNFAFRYIPAAGPTLVERNLDRVEVELTKYNASEFM